MKFVTVLGIITALATNIYGYECHPNQLDECHNKAKGWSCASGSHCHDGCEVFCDNGGCSVSKPLADKPAVKIFQGLNVL